MNCNNCIHFRKDMQPPGGKNPEGRNYGSWCVKIGLSTREDLLRCGGDDFEQVLQAELPLHATNTLEEAFRQRDEAMGRAELNAGEEWNDYIDKLIVELAKKYPGGFTGDDIMDNLMIMPPNTTRATGPAVLRAVRRGVIKWSGNLWNSRRRHGTSMKVWRAA